MTYWVVLLHVLAMLYALRAVRGEIGGRRSPHPDRVTAIRLSVATAAVLLLCAVVVDLGGPARSWWELAMLACVVTVALAVRILKGDGRP